MPWLDPETEDYYHGDRAHHSHIEVPERPSEAHVWRDGRWIEDTEKRAALDAEAEAEARRQLGFDLLPYIADVIDRQDALDEALKRIDPDAKIPELPEKAREALARRG